MNRIALFFVASIAAIVLAGCASEKPASAPESFDSGSRGDNVTESADKMVIRNWSDRGIGEIANPAHILNARHNIWSAVKPDFEINPTDIVRVGIGDNVSQNAALIQANVLFPFQLGQELREKVIGRAAAASEGQLDNSEFGTAQKAAIEVKVELSGFRRVADFWQQQELTGADGRKRTRYVAYILYACPSDAWDKIVATYLMDIVGRLPEKKTQQAIAGLFEEFKADTRREEERTDAQWRAELAAQNQAVETHQRLAMAQTPGGIVEAKAAGTVAQTQAIEEARTLRTAIRSGDPVAIAAATIGAGDFDAVAALAAAAGL
jgi:hypothetical protein